VSRLHRIITWATLWLLLAAPVRAETWKTVASDRGVTFTVRLHHPHVVRKVPLVDGARWDIAVTNSVRNHVSKVLPSGPIASVTIDQKARYVRIVARWRFPYAIAPKVQDDRFSFLIPYEITRSAVTDLATGLRFVRLHRWTPAGPVFINAVYADLRRFSLRPELATRRRGFSTEPVSSIARRVKAWAAVNGSFFSPRGGAPIGLLMLDGQIVSSSFFNRSVFGVRYDGSCFINNARLHAALRVGDSQTFLANAVNRPTAHNQLILYTPHWGDRTRSVPDPSRREFAIAEDGTILSICTGNSVIPKDGFVASAQGRAVAEMLQHVHVGSRVIVYSQLSNEWEGVKYAIGGGPTLVDQGQVKVTARQERFGAEIARGRAPRTAIGYLGGTQAVLVAVDGRQKHSIGMTLYELARTMRELGSREAINLDGGGSTAMVVRGRLVNHPSDGVERAVNNAVVLVGGG
jgi:exopolysaccharide biosynthesis protein